MSLLEAFLLGIVQGLTEFLPVSSSGHIELVKALGNIKVEKNLTFSLILHSATALSTIIVFRHKILKIIRDLFSKESKSGREYASYIVLSMVPAVLVGIFLKDQIDSLFDKNVLLVGCMLLVTGVILYWSDQVKNVEGKWNIKLPTALVMGVVQAIAIIPGISRSGSTIASGILMKSKREEAADFSFLMVIPVIFGAMAKDTLDQFQSGGFDVASLGGLPILIGFITALVTGLFAIKWMIKLVKNSSLKWFAFYCFLLGGSSMAWHFFG